MKISNNRSVGSNRKLLIIWSGPDTGTSANLFRELCRAFECKNTVQTAPNSTIHGTRLVKILHHIACDFRRWPKIFKNDTIVLHSYAALSLPSVLLAWFLRKRIVIVHWDAYPITVEGKRLGGLYRKLFDHLEHFLVSLSTRVVIPSDDFLPFVSHPDIQVMPLWPSLPIGTVKPRRPHENGKPVRLAFVGQAALTRGLPQAILRLGRESPTEFELHIFSPKPPDPDLAKLATNVRLVPRGYLDRGALITALDMMDFGLISLHPGMGQPGFPSKVFDYVAAGLPVVYTGRPLPAFASLLERTGVGFALGDLPVDWPSAMLHAATHMVDAVQAFAEETKLTTDKLERAFF